MLGSRHLPAGPVGHGPPGVGDGAGGVVAGGVVVGVRADGGLAGEYGPGVADSGHGVPPVEGEGGRAKGSRPERRASSRPSTSTHGGGWTPWVSRAAQSIERRTSVMVPASA